MFKKNIWIVGLLVALAIMFIGCVDAFVDEDGVETEVFDLQKTLADAPLGVIANDAAWTAIFSKTPFMMCGGPSNGQYSIINDGGTKKVKVEKMGPTWGVGFDVYNTAGAGNKGANFKGGDVLTIKGTASADGLIANINTSGEKRLGDKDLGKSFDEKFTLTDADASSVRTGSPKAIRIHFKNNNGSERKGTIIIEQITLTGKRKAGDDKVPPAGDDDDYTVGKVYQIPTGAAAGTFYMDLNRCLSTSAEVGNNDNEKAGSLVPVPTTIAANKVTFTFTKLNQRVAIKFTEDQLDMIQDGGGVTVTITGTATVGGACTDSFRYHIGDIKATSNWNATGGNNGADEIKDGSGNVTTPADPSFNAVITHATKNDQNFTANYKERKSIRHLILNYRGTSSAAAADKVDVEITSILIKPIAGRIASLSAITAAKMPFPVAGKAVTEIVDTDGFKGMVEWYPEPPKGRFALSTIYYAKIVLTAYPGYSLPVTATEIGTPTVSGISAYYNPETRTLTTANYPRTDSKYPPLPAGVFFKMTDWLVDTSAANTKPVNVNNNNLWDSRPFQFNDYGKRNEAIVDKTAKTVTINAAGRDQAYKGIDIYLTDAYFGDGACDPSIYKVNVTVKGKITAYDDSTAATKPSPTPTKYTFLVEESDGSYLKVIEKKDLAIPAAPEAFNYTAEIPEKFNLSNKLRIHLSIPYLGFVLEEVSFENKGLR